MVDGNWRGQERCKGMRTRAVMTYVHLHCPNSTANVPKRAACRWGSTAEETVLLPVKNLHGGEAAPSERLGSGMTLIPDTGGSPASPHPVPFVLLSSARTAVWQGWMPGFIRQLGQVKITPKALGPGHRPASALHPTPTPAAAGGQGRWRGQQEQPPASLKCTILCFILHIKKITVWWNFPGCNTSKSATRWLQIQSHPHNHSADGVTNISSCPEVLMAPRREERCRADPQPGLPCRAVLTAAQQQGLGSGLLCCSSRPQHIPEHLQPLSHCLFHKAQLLPASWEHFCADFSPALAFPISNVLHGGCA